MVRLLLAAFWFIALAAPPAMLAQQRFDTVRVSLAEARARAERANPELAAARLDTAIARGRLRQAGVLSFNPTVDILARPSGGDVEAGVSQEVEVFGQRGTRRRAERAGVDFALATTQDVARLVVATVDRAFYRLIAAAQRRTLSEEVLALNTRLEDVGRRQLAEGEVSRIDYNLAVVELGRARARATVARREQDQAGLELARLIGLPTGTPMAAAVDSNGLRPEPVTPLDLDALTSLALARRPDLLAREAGVRRAEARVSTSRREALPNPVLRGVIEQPTVGGPRTFRAGVGLTLPFLNRSQGERQALRAESRQAHLEFATLAVLVRTEVASAILSYQSAEAEVQTLAATVLAPARQNRQLAEVAYREGKIGVPVLLLVQNQAIDAELEYWSAWLAAREARAALAAVTAETVETAPSSNTGVKK